MPSVSPVVLRMILAVLVLTSLGQFVHAEETKIVGDYVCTGTNADGGAYRGIVKISKNADVYLVKWIYGESTFDGTAILSGKTLSVAWIQKKGNAIAVGVATYTRQADGSWKGKWAPVGGNGKVLPETLTPSKRVI